MEGLTPAMSSPLGLHTNYKETDSYLGKGETVSEAGCRAFLTLTLLAVFPFAALREGSLLGGEVVPDWPIVEEPSPIRKIRAMLSPGSSPSATKSSSSQYGWLSFITPYSLAT